MVPAVVLDNLVKTHGSVCAVDHVSLSINKGEFFSLLGPSGSGKTSILRLIAGLDIPDSGTIRIQERVVNTDPPHARPVNMVFQQYALFPHMTVFDNIAFGLKMQRQGVSQIRKAVEDIIALVHLEGKSDRLPAQLSGGEQQRVALARALVNRPVVLLLDEPLAALDQQLRLEMQQELKRLQQELGATFICVTHQQEEALMLSNRLGVMQGGKVLQVGTPQEIYQQPVSSAVAQFIGLSNSVSGPMTRREKDVCWVEPAALPPIVARCSSGAVEQGFATVIVRPEDVHITDKASSNGNDNTLSAIVSQAVFGGNEMVYQFRLQNDATWTARVPVGESHHSFSVGQPVYLQWSARHGLALFA